MAELKYYDKEQGKYVPVNIVINNSQTDLSNYFNKEETKNEIKSYVDTQVSTIPKFKVEVVTDLPTSGISNNTIYLKKSSEDSENLYTEYIYVNNKWEKLGTQSLDLSQIYTKSESDDKFSTKKEVGNLTDSVNQSFTSILSKLQEINS